MVLSGHKVVGKTDNWHAGGNGRRAEDDGHRADDNGRHTWGELGNPVGNEHNKGSL